MIIKQYQKPFVPKYANYDYTKVYDGNGRFIGWIKIYHTLAKVVKQMIREKIIKPIVGWLIKRLARVYDWANYNTLIAFSFANGKDEYSDFTLTKNEYPRQ